MGYREQLVGALGLASMEVREQMEGYAASAAAGQVVALRNAVAVTGPASALGMNEVGVTDSVMKVLWLAAPAGVAQAISSVAEHDYLGADIAIVHRSRNGRPGVVVLYQAKLAETRQGLFRLKSEITTDQCVKLRQRSVTLGGDRYRACGRLALYQVDLPGCGHWSTWRQRFHYRTTSGEVFRSTFTEQGCSPWAILAVPAPMARTSEVHLDEANPWEFDLSEIFNNRSLFPVGLVGFEAEDLDAAQRTDVLGGLAADLREQFNIPAERRLYLIVR